MAWSGRSTLRRHRTGWNRCSHDRRKALSGRMLRRYRLRRRNWSGHTPGSDRSCRLRRFGYSPGSSAPSVGSSSHPVPPLRSIRAGRSNSEVGAHSFRYANRSSGMGYRAARPRAHEVRSSADVLRPGERSPVARSAHVARHCAACWPQDAAQIADAWSERQNARFPLAPPISFRRDSRSLSHSADEVRFAHRNPLDSISHCPSASTALRIRHSPLHGRYFRDSSGSTSGC